MAAPLRYCRLLLLLPFAIVLGCEHKSPVEPTPPPVTCTYTLSSSSLSFGATGGTGSVTVTTGASCAWTAASDRGWMTIGPGANGSGPGSVTVSLTANPGTESRSGTLTIAGQAVAVTQNGTTPCTVSVSPGSATFTKDAATGTFTVTAPTSCAWSAASSDAWITIPSGASATGTAAVTYAISRNTSESARTGSIHVDGAAFSIVQQGDTPACDFHASPVLINACMAVPYELSVTVATGASCGWTVASDTPWISMSGPASRIGPGELRFRVGDNYDAPRLGVVKVRWDTPTAGQNVQVSQAGCRYALTSTGRSVPAGGGAFSFDVYQQSDPYECGGPLQNGCVWSATADVPWITITTPMPQAGDGRVGFTAASNTGAARIGRITVRDKVFVVTQDAR